MTEDQHEAKGYERDDIAALLPWYAAGTLEPKDAQRVERALRQDADLVRQLEIVREELDETVIGNERLAGASPHALDALFKAIDAEPKRRSAAAGLFDLGGRLADWLSPKTLAWAAVAAALVIAVQAGILVDLAGRTGGSTYETASAPNGAGARDGIALMVGFQPTAQAAAIDALLAEIGASVVEGPRGGLYKVRIGPASMPRAETERKLALLRLRTAVVRFAAPSR